ncbi:hypothetical protein DYB32_000812 [Aphanomyces invadans]|uniref:Uncharacterized protein n=1 Tax=Aphanomyces invadans TaxID=157072 RepID=A0A3R7D6R5_9STRA|nr:hypothetical protein DYB32_000812 [Aphanomyces invadans]
MTLYLNYQDSVAFARQFGLVSHGGVTIAEFAAAYIDSVEKMKGSTRRQLTFLGFCHLLLRLTLKLYGHAPVSISMQLKDYAAQIHATTPHQVVRNVAIRQVHGKHVCLTPDCSR